MKTLKYLIATGVICLNIQFAFCQADQQNNGRVYLEGNLRDFTEIQQQMESYFEGKETGRGSGYKQWKRWEYKTQRRLNPDGTVANWAKRNLDEYHRYIGQQPVGRSTNGYWTEVAPTSWTNGNQGEHGGLGLVNCVAFHPTDGGIIYIGTPAGGLWKSTDAGTTWQR